MNYRYLIIINILLLLCSCNDHYFDENNLPVACENNLVINIDQPIEVFTRNATNNECIIDNMYVIVFNQSGSFIDAEKINVTTNIIDGGKFNKKIIKSQLSIAANNKVVILINTGVSTLPTGLTFDNINEKFQSNNWNINQAGTMSGRGMPMSGYITWSNAAINNEINIKRAVSKIQLSIDPNIEYGAGVSPFNVNATTWTMALYPDQLSILSYEDRITIPELSSLKFKEVTDYDFNKYPLLSNNLNEKQVLYIPEFGSSSYAKKVNISSNRFHKDRLCMLIKNNGKYYRIDFFEKLIGDYPQNRIQWMDLKRNHSYKVIINKVQVNGYPSVQDALSSPASNITYTIECNDGNSGNNSIISNGQYALSVEYDKLEAYCFHTSELSLTARVILPEGVAMPSNNKITASGITITSKEAKVGSTNTVIKFKLNDENRELSGFITIAVGNLVKTIKIDVTEQYFDVHSDEKTFIGDFSNINWTSLENMHIVNANASEMTIRCRDNTIPVKWIIPSTGELSNENVIEAEPVFEMKSYSGYRWDSNNTGNCTKVMITQAAPDYVGWAGGEPGQTGATHFSKRLIIETVDDIFYDYFAWAPYLDRTGVQNLEKGMANTKTLYGWGVGFKAAYECMMKNDKNFDGYLDQVEMNDNPWYLPAHYQMSEIWLAYPNFNTVFKEGYYYLTSTEYKINTEMALLSKFVRGHMHYAVKTEKYILRCVKELP